MAIRSRTRPCVLRRDWSPAGSLERSGRQRRTEAVGSTGSRHGLTRVFPLALLVLACSAEPQPSPSTTGTRGSPRATTPAPTDQASATPTPSPSALPRPLAGLPSADDVTGRIVYVTPEGDLWVVNGDGSGRRQLTDSGDGSDYSPAWSPDGERIAFRTTRGDAPDTAIFLIDVDGTNEREISEPGVGGLFPAWSPDGEWVTYSTSQITLVRPDGTGRRSLGTDGECSTWSPAGTHIAFCSTR